jgi:hypothetical protein
VGGRHPPTPALRVCEDCPARACDGCPVKTDPDHFREIERRDRKTVRRNVVLAVVAAIYAIGLGYVALQTHTIVRAHNTELASTEAAAKSAATTGDSARTAANAVLKVLHADQNDRVTEAKDIQIVGTYAGQLSAEFSTNHATSAAGQRSICAAVNGIIAAQHLAVTPCSIP